MARFSSSRSCGSRSYGSSFRSSYSGGGFTNSRTGSYVSSARAHQHTGTSFGGYTKTQSSSTGNYYMRPSGR